MYNLDRKYSFYGINKAAMLAGYKQALGFALDQWRNTM
jgi:hypothetical protein